MSFKSPDTEIDLVEACTSEIAYLEGKITNLREIWDVLKAKEAEFKDLHQKFDDVIIEDENVPRAAVNMGDISQRYKQMKLQRSNSYAEIEKEAEILGETIAQLETRLLLKKEELEGLKNESRGTTSMEINEDISVCDVNSVIKESNSQMESTSENDQENETKEAKLVKTIKKLKKELRLVSQNNSQLEARVTTLEKQKEELLTVNHDWDEQYRLLKEDKDHVIRNLQRKLQSSPSLLQDELVLQRNSDSGSSHVEHRRIDDLVKEKDELAKQLESLRKKQTKTDALWLSAKKMITEEREARLDATRNTKVAQEKVKDLEVELARTRAQGAVLKDEIERLVSEGRKIHVSASGGVLQQEQVEQIEMLKHQVRAYVDDFANERSDRERIQNEKERLREELKASENEITFLNEQLRAYKDDFKKERCEKERIQRQFRDREKLLAAEPWYHSPPNEYNPGRARQHERNYRGQPALLPREIQEFAFRQSPGKATESHATGLYHGRDPAGNVNGGYDVIDGPSTTYDCPRCNRKFSINNRRAFEDHVDICTK